MHETGVAPPWYYNYEQKLAAVREAKSSFHARCTELGIQPVAVMLSYTKEIVAAAVHESNWQEGVEVSLGRTRELSDVVFADFSPSKNPGLDIDWILQNHRERVLKAKRQGISEDDLVALNLSATYRAIEWLLIDIQTRYNAILARLLDTLLAALPKEALSGASEAIERGKRASADLFGSQPLPFPVTHGVRSGAEFLAKGGIFEHSADLEMLELRHVHLLHRLLFMGVFPAARCGVFRRSHVNVGRNDLFFPPPDAVQPLMKEFVRSYPLSVAFGNSSDEVMAAAKFSHRFVAIHPYNDGNGRISRALMNLVLCGQHPFVALKATTQKARTRYYYSLRRADRGDLRPLACLIAMSLVETYNRILGSLGKN